MTVQVTVSFYNGQNSEILPPTMLHAMDSVLFDTIYFSFLYQSWTLNLDWDNECESTL